MHKIYHTILTSTITLTLFLGSWNGRVALFTKESEGPLQLYPVRLELLPVTDQEQLLNGISIRDPDELTRILEDLLS